jgi:hypothetical protein
MNRTTDTTPTSAQPCDGAPARLWEQATAARLVRLAEIRAELAQPLRARFLTVGGR